MDWYWQVLMVMVALLFLVLFFLWAFFAFFLILWQIGKRWKASRSFVEVIFSILVTKRLERLAEEHEKLIEEGKTSELPWFGQFFKQEEGTFRLIGRGHRVISDAGSFGLLSWSGHAFNRFAKRIGIGDEWSPVKGIGWAGPSRHEVRVPVRRYREKNGKVELFDERVSALRVAMIKNLIPVPGVDDRDLRTYDVLLTAIFNVVYPYRYAAEAQYAIPTLAEFAKEAITAYAGSHALETAPSEYDKIGRAVIDGMRTKGRDSELVERFGIELVRNGIIIADIDPRLEDQRVIKAQSDASYLAKALVIEEKGRGDATAARLEAVLVGLARAVGGFFRALNPFRRP